MNFEATFSVSVSLTFGAELPEDFSRYLMLPETLNLILLNFDGCMFTSISVIYLHYFPNEYF